MTASADTPFKLRDGVSSSDEHVRSVVVVPAAHIGVARDFCHAFMVARNYPDGAESILPTPLSPTGSDPPTHYACFKTWIRREIDAVHTLLNDERNSGKMFITDRMLTTQSSREELQSLMAHIEGSDADTLAALGLVVIDA